MLSEPRATLPIRRTSLIGRQADLATLRSLVLQADGRLLTLTGAGGSGKTSLALEVARGLLDDFPDGVWLVELAPLSDPTLVAQAVGSPLGVRESPDRPLLDGLLTYLEPRALLLLLDNCEHLIDPCAQLTEQLLERCPRLRILATGREPLRIGGEVVWQVPTLAVPDPGRPHDLDELATIPAVRLFVERAQAAQPRFRLTAQNAAAVAQVCARLDGMPLALELAAARMRALTADQLAERLDDAFRLLVGGSRTAPSRQQTLRATLDWSYSLLDAAEQRALARLAVFAGGWELPAAEAVLDLDEEGAEPAIDRLARLVDKSLVLAEEYEGQERYRLLEPVRQYARRYLEASADAAATRARHADYYAALVEESHWAMRGPRQGAWFGRVTRELGNLRAALGWAAEQGEIERGLRLAGGLGMLWLAIGHLGEGTRWLALFLARDQEGSLANRAQALAWLALLTTHQGDVARGEALAHAALALSNHAAPDIVAWSDFSLATAAGYRGEYAIAGMRFAAARERWRALGDRFGVACTFLNEGEIARVRGDRGAAQGSLEQAVAEFLGAGDAWGRTVALALLGYLALEHGEYARARALAVEGVTHLRALGTRWKLPECLEVLACVASATTEPERAARLFGAAEALREHSGAPLVRADRPAYDRGVAATRAALADAAFAAAWAAGRAMSPWQAMEEALAPGAAAAPRPPRSRDSPGARGDELTPREREVAALVGRGLTNQQIAQALIISEGTARSHVEHIQAKLDLHSRAQLTAWAVRYELMDSEQP